MRASAAEFRRLSPYRPGQQLSTMRYQTLGVSGLASLRVLPDMEKLEDAGLLTKDNLLASEIPIGIEGEEDEEVSRDAVDEPNSANELEP